MKKLFLFINLSFCIYYHAKATTDSININITSNLLSEEFCDACGCAAGNGSSGFESLLNPKFIGVKYFGQHYKARENLFLDALTQDQYFNTIQLWGRIPVTEKLSIYGSIPYQTHTKKTEQGDNKIDGIGDINIMGIYQLYSSESAVHQFNGGLGVKIPTGKFNAVSVTSVNPSFQLGTGSWDYQLVLNYKFQKNKLAVLLNTDYNLKSENKKQYQFGNQWNYTATAFYQLLNTGNSIISAKAGLQGEVYAANKQFSETIPRTSGNAFYSKIGVETSLNKISLGSELMLPLRSNLAGGDIEARSRVSVFVNFGL